MTVKRGEGRALVPLDELLARERADLEPADSLTADRIFERRWALTLLEQVLTQLESEYQSAGNAKLFDCLKEFLSDEPGRRSQADVAAELGMTENAVKQAFHRLRQRYRQLLQRRDRPDRRGARRCGRRAAPFHFCAPGVTSERISISTKQRAAPLRYLGLIKFSACAQNAARPVFADSPRGFCSVCLFRTGLRLA